MSGIEYFQMACVAAVMLALAVIWSFLQNVLTWMMAQLVDD